MTILFKALQVILALSVLILIHEAGHFMWARIFRIRVDKFFLFFDIGGKKLFSTRMGWFVKLFPAAEKWETEYGIGWLPLGGYCKIAGMIDESMDTEALKQPPQPWEFRSKKPWQRFLVMAGGVLNNFILAIVLFCAMLAIWGDNYIPADHPVYVNGLARELGFRTGDRILYYDDEVPSDFMSLQPDLARRRVRTATVLRGADTLTLYIDQAATEEILNTPGMFDLAVPFVIEAVPETSRNFGAGLERGDRIIEVSSQSTPYLQDAQKILREHTSQTLPVKLVRGADTVDVALQVDSLGMVGVYLQNQAIEHRSYSVAASIPAGCSLAWNTVTGYLRDLRLVATPSTGAYKSVGSFVAIGQVFPSNWNWQQFLYILAILSIMLGVMNLLPIPALDGGHMLFCLWEMLTGRKPSDRFLTVAQLVGMALLFLLLFLAMGNDFARIIH